MSFYWLKTSLTINKKVSNIHIGGLMKILYKGSCPINITNLPAGEQTGFSSE